MTVMLTAENASDLGDGAKVEKFAQEVLAADRSRPPAVRTQLPRMGPRRARRWSRTGTATAFGAGPEERGGAVGWSWEIRRDGPEHRQIHVEVSPGPYLVTDLPAEARNAIRSRGATAVDAFLDEDNPPVRITVSTQGVQAHYAQLDSSD
jgi:hypothetical protein